LVVKDTHDTAVVRTTHGYWLPLDKVPEFDELLVQRARRAGSIVVGRAVVPECAAGSHTTYTVFGATRNPYHVSRSQEGQGPAGDGPVAAIVDLDLDPEPSGYRWERP
jgi:amidase